MKKILFIIALLFVTACGTFVGKTYVEYTMKDGTKFMCKNTLVVENKKVSSVDNVCQWKVVRDGAVFGCTVSVDKLQKGYKPSVELDCSLEAK